jgi:hypothetical protein
MCATNPVAGMERDGARNGGLAPIPKHRSCVSTHEPGWPSETSWGRPSDSLFRLYLRHYSTRTSCGPPLPSYMATAHTSRNFYGGGVVCFFAAIKSHSRRAACASRRPVNCATLVFR